MTTNRRIAQVRSRSVRVINKRRNEMDSPAGYLHLGFILISYPNLIVIGAMIVLFVIALLAPFHGVGGKEDRS
jgi:hypothetical protein